MENQFVFQSVTQSISQSVRHFQVSQWRQEFARQTTRRSQDEINGTAPSLPVPKLTRDNYSMTVPADKHSIGGWIYSVSQSISQSVSQSVSQSMCQSSCQSTTKHNVHRLAELFSYFWFTFVIVFFPKPKQ